MKYHGHVVKIEQDTIHFNSQYRKKYLHLHVQHNTVNIHNVWYKAIDLRRTLPYDNFNWPIRDISGTSDCGGCYRIDIINAK